MSLYLYLLITCVGVLLVLLSFYLLRVYRKDKKKVDLIRSILFDNVEAEEKLERIRKVLQA